MHQRKTFNKLVRDKIPEIIKSKGGDPDYQVLEDSEYVKHLEEKLKEECAEVISAQDKESRAEELADVLEVITCMAKTVNITMEEIEKIRTVKKEKRGSFEKKIFLKSSKLINNL